MTLKIKRIILFVLLSSLICFFGAMGAELGDQSVFAVSGEDETLSASSIVFKNESEEIISEVSSDSEITASVFIKNEGADSVEVVFFLNLYKNNRIIDTDIDKKTVPVGEPILLEASLSTHSDVSGMSVSAILWNNLSDMKTLSAAALLPARESKAAYLKVNGIKLNGFSPDISEYEMENPEGVIPEVSAVPLDGSGFFNVENPVYFPGETLVRVMLPNGIKSEYVIKYKNNSSFASNPSSVPTPNNIPEFRKDLKEGGYPYSDRTNMTFSFLSEELKGKDYFACPMSWAVLSKLKKYWNGTEGGSQSMFSFELTRNATIRVFCEEEAAVEGSFSEADGWMKEISDEAYYKRVYNNNEFSANVMYYKEYQVTSGETVRVDIPNHGGAAAYVVVPDYKY